MQGPKENVTVIKKQLYKASDQEKEGVLSVF